MKSAIELIAEERARQISVEGWTPEHDAEHTERELVDAAVAYLFADDDDPIKSHPGVWPFEPEAWKPSDDPIRNLVKAGALIVAEISRIQREGGES